MANKTLMVIVILGLAFTGMNSAVASVIPEHVIKAYQLGMQGDEEQNYQAFNFLTEINESSPDPIVLAMLGSAETRRARSTSRPWQKMQFTEKGIAKLTKAVDQAESLPYALRARVKITAGCTFAQVPEMLNRAEHGRYLLSQVIEQTESFASLDPTLKVSAYRCASIAAEKLSDKEDARRLMQLAEQVSVQQQYGKE